MYICEFQLKNWGAQANNYCTTQVSCPSRNGLFPQRSTSRSFLMMEVLEKLTAHDAFVWLVRAQFRAYPDTLRVSDTRHCVNCRWVRYTRRFCWEIHHHVLVAETPSKGGLCKYLQCNLHSSLHLFGQRSEKVRFLHNSVGSSSFILRKKLPSHAAGCILLENQTFRAGKYF